MEKNSQDWDNITSITREKILPGIEDAISNDNPLFNRWFKRAIRQSGGVTVDKVVYFAHSTQGGWYSGLDTLKTGIETVRTRATWNWRQAHQSIVFSNIDLAKNGGQEAVFSLLAESTRDSERAMKDRFGTGLYVAQTGDAIESLVDGCDDLTKVWSSLNLAICGNS